MKLIKNHNDFLKENSNDYVYDGSGVLYTQQPIFKEEDKKAELTSKFGEEIVKITIQFACTLSSKLISQDLLQLFNIIYKKALISLKLTRIGKNYYNLKNSIEISQYNLKLLPGLIETIYISKKGLLFNADINFKLLRTKSILDEINEYKKLYEKDYKKNFERDYLGSIIMCKYNNRTVKCNKIDWTKTPKNKFEKDGKMISYEEYFFTQYKIKIGDKNQPLIIFEKSKDRIEHYIPELCLLTGMSDTIRNDKKMMLELKKITGLGPNDRIEQISNFVKTSNENEDFKNSLDDWGFLMSPKLLSVEGRKLKSPDIDFGNGKTLLNQQGILLILIF
jgi:aubergine